MKNTDTLPADLAAMTRERDAVTALLDLARVGHAPTLIERVQMLINWKNTAESGWKETEKRANESALARTLLREAEEGLRSVSSLWPMPPHCPEVNPGWVGERDGKQRAILLEAALEISRNTLERIRVAREGK